MDFFKLIQSLDELLYEFLGWLLFYPITLWRVLRHPARSMLLAESELAKGPEARFDTMLGPPLFLFLSLIIIHIAELFLNPAVSNDLIRSHTGISRYITNDTNLIVFRVVVFGLLPLTAARRLLRIRGQELDKVELRGPFYAQCYASAIYALILNAGTFAFASELDARQWIGGGLMAAAVIWFLAVETWWFAEKQGHGFVRGFGNALVVLGEWLAIVAIVYLVVH